MQGIKGLIAQVADTMHFFVNLETDSYFPEWALNICLYTILIIVQYINFKDKSPRNRFPDRKNNTNSNMGPRVLVAASNIAASCNLKKHELTLSADIDAGLEVYDFAFVRVPWLGALKFEVEG